ncbi:MAG: tRNA (uridine(34)/cytosine(34)/5-carboxymethylaminomethyluridine(34)-2'-O)-methyltransferase TrmL [Pseudohongiellaceae bacterium]|nr:tRNA (uridine(34)/cytosine(34)/5-carboxymethylaminomethyluridine(34)-2'-O)-methyltransferase TrmL [Pseudohongiellaceae bacterium]
MLHIVLFEPEIPPNTGNLIRLAANTDTHLHLIEPLGFSMDSKQVRRAGLDYHEVERVSIHSCWEEFCTKVKSKRLFALSTKGTQRYSDIQFQADDVLIFGPETRGLPDSIRESELMTGTLTIPMQRGSRSLNLSNSVAIVVYEALRQLDFPFK